MAQLSIEEAIMFFSLLSLSSRVRAILHLRSILLLSMTCIAIL